MSNKISVAEQIISLNYGGGVISGIGEKFTANPVTRTGSMTVPIATSPGRSSSILNFRCLMTQALAIAHSGLAGAFRFHRSPAKQTKVGPGTRMLWGVMSSSSPAGKISSSRDRYNSTLQNLGMEVIKHDFELIDRSTVDAEFAESYNSI